MNYDYNDGTIRTKTPESRPETGYALPLLQFYLLDADHCIRCNDVLQHRTDDLSRRGRQPKADDCHFCLDTFWMYCVYCLRLQSLFPKKIQTARRAYGSWSFQKETFPRTSQRSFLAEYRLVPLRDSRRHPFCPSPVE
ncbi:unknown [Blautia hydrogenotrophica CAG:147]|nr:unknown [Blautia hydrogenotrophica CAG:147]